MSDLVITEYGKYVPSHTRLGKRALPVLQKLSTPCKVTITHLECTDFRDIFLYGFITEMCFPNCQTEVFTLSAFRNILYVFLKLWGFESSLL